MASAPAPSVASTKETTNYARLCRLLVDVGSQALRDTFDRIHPPAGLHLVLARNPAHRTLQSLRMRRILNPRQWGQLYPTIPSSVSSASFDITLLMVLLRNICCLTPPVTGWHNLPSAADTSTEANIVRVNYYRNTIYSHASQASVDYATFNTHWQDISNALVALGGASYGAAIRKLKNECMDPDTEEHHRELLKEWKKDEHRIKEKLEEMEEVFKQMKEEKGNIKDKLGEVEENVKKTLEQMGLQVRNVSEKLDSLRESSQVEDKLQQMKSEIRNMSDKLDTLMAQRETEDEGNIQETRNKKDIAKESPFHRAASTSRKVLEQEKPSLSSDKTLRVTLLSSEWESSKGGLSTINRELAIQLAKHPKVEAYVYLPKCSEEEKKVAGSHSVKLIEAEELPGSEPINWLASLPKDHLPHCVIGHGLHLGRQIPLIKRHHDCQWIQVVHTAPEELGMYKSYEEAIFKGEQKHEAEVKLCKVADQVVAVGPKLADAYSRYLRSSKKDQDVLNLTPSIFTEFLSVQQATEERRKFFVLVFGRGDSEDFKLKGYDIAVQAVAELKDSSYQLMFVGAPAEKEDEVAKKLLQHGIPPSQLTVRRFTENREQLANLFCEVDLAIMPSRTEGFGLTALEALSAGLPVLVSGNSGLGDALKKVSSGVSHVVDSEDPKEWAKAIKIVREKSREVRLEDANLLREKYEVKYSWQKQCDCLVEKMLHLSFGNIQDKLERVQNQVENVSKKMDNLGKPKETSRETGPISSNNPGAYTRSGPTYDQQSLYSAQEDDSIEYNSRAQAPPQAAAWQVSQQLSQPQQPVSGFGVGRGHGRGQGSQLNQPLRRPNLPGMAAGGTGSAYPDTSWSSITASDQPSASRLATIFQHGPEQIPNPTLLDEGH